MSVSARPEWQEWVPKVEAANAGTFSDVQTLERDPTYWLRLHYALRDGRLADASDAQRQLGALGFDVQLRDVHPASESGCTSRDRFTTENSGKTGKSV